MFHATSASLTEGASLNRTDDFLEVTFPDGRLLRLDDTLEAVLWGMVHRQTPNAIGGAVSLSATEVEDAWTHLGEVLVPETVHPRSDLRFMAHLRTVCERLELVQASNPPLGWRGGRVAVA